MKQGKKPTKKQCMLMQTRRINPKNWLVERDTPEVMIIVSRAGKNKRSIYKEA